MYAFLFGAAPFIAAHSALPQHGHGSAGDDLNERRPFPRTEAQSSPGLSQHFYSAQQWNQDSCEHLRPDCMFYRFGVTVLACGPQETTPHSQDRT